MKKSSKFICIVAAALCTAIPLAACADGGTDNGAKKDESEIFGSFTYQETLGSRAGTLQLTSDSSVNDRSHIHSTVYPMNGIAQGQPIAYAMDQRLKLNRNFSYKYDYSVLLSNPQDWGGQVARLVVSITGEFEYDKVSDDKYSVLLSDPTGGTLTVTSFRINGLNTYGLNIHSQPDLVIDYSIMSDVKDYRYDKYVASRVVVVDRSVKALTDDVFYPDLLDYIALYSTY